MKDNAEEKVTQFVGSCWHPKGIKIILRILGSISDSTSSFKFVEALHNRSKNIMGGLNENFN